MAGFAHGSAGSVDFASSWLSLFALFEAASGFRLRLDIADTLLIRGGRLAAWYFTARDGTVARASEPEITEQAILQRLAGASSALYMHPALNPNSYVALALYEHGLAKPMQYAELQALVSTVTQAPDPSQAPSDMPFCVQAFIPPARGLRYFCCALIGQDPQPRCTTFARRFALRQQSAGGVASAAPSTAEWAAARAASAAALAALAAAADDSQPPTAEEQLVERQLMALGLVEPREWQPTDVATTDASLPVSAAIKAQVQAAVTNLIAFVERAHGQVIQGIVAEFVQSPHNERSVVLLAVHAVQFDTHSSRSRPGALGERWADMIGRGAGSPTSPTGSGLGRPTVPRRNVPQTMLASAAGSRPASAPFYRLRPTPLSAMSPKAPLYSSPPLRPESAHAAAVSSVLQRGRAARSNPQFTPTPANGHMSARNIASASRKGAGGNAVPLNPSAASYSLWSARDMPTTNTLTGNIALELEVLREKLQRQADIEARAQAALAQLSASCGATESQLVRQLEQLQAEVERARRDMGDVEGDHERLKRERQDLQIELTAVQMELKEAKSLVDRERATLASSVRANNEQTDVIDVTIQQLRADNEQLSAQASTLQRRVDENNEVLDATKAQLLEYRTNVSALQQQLRRGKKLSAGPEKQLPGSVSTNGLTSLLSDRPSRDAPFLFDGFTPGSSLADDAQPLHGLLFSSTGQLQGSKSRVPSAASARNNTSGGPVRTSDSFSQGKSSKSREGIVSFNGGMSSYRSVPITSSGSFTGLQASALPFHSVDLAPPALTASVSALNVGTTDPVSLQLQELRRARTKLLAEPSGDITAANQAAIKAGAGSVEEAKAARLESARNREHWRPNYELIDVSDLFIAGGELMERMISAHAAVIASLKHVENELLDIFHFYARIKRVRMHDDRLVMCLDQFCRLASEVGLKSNDPVVEDIYMSTADKTMGNSEVGSIEPYIDSELFPEAIARLGAVKYDWRVPFTDDEADTDVELPRPLADALQEVTAAAAAAVTHAAAAERAAVSSAQGGIGSPGRPWLPSPASSAKGSRPGSAIKAAAPPTTLMAAAALAASSPGGIPKLPPMSSADEHSGEPLYGPEQVLALMIKTFLYHDLLAKARRPKTAGSTVARQKAQERTTPADVWKV